MRRLLLLTALLCGAVACAAPPKLGPTPHRDDVMQFPTPYIYNAWWRSVEQCSGLKGDLAPITWFVAPRPFLALPDDPGIYLGMYFPGEHKIVLGLFEPKDSVVVMHEALHALLDQNGLRDDKDQHPLRYFRDLCGPLLGPLYGT